MKTPFYRFTFFLFICLTLPLIATPQVISIPEPALPPPDVRAYFNLDPYYEQWIDVKGFPVLASGKVNPYALKEAAWIIEKMIGHRPDILQSMTESKARLSIIPHTEVITEIPEYRDTARPDFLVYRERGWGGSERRGVISASEESILQYPGARSGGNILIHEIAHSIHRFGLNSIDPTFDERLRRTYEAAMEQGLWQNTYASSDKREYWAESTNAWFYPSNRNKLNPFGNTRQDLRAYDPGIATLLNEIYGDNQWRYTPVADHIHLPHLQGFDPQNTPTFVDFPELKAIFRQLRIPSSDGNGMWVNLPPIEPTRLQGLIEINVHGAMTAIVFVNLSKDDILLYGIRPSGTEEYWTRAPPGFIRSTPSRINKLWVVKDIHGKDLAVFQTREKTGRALIQTNTDPSASVSLREVSIPDANLRAAIEVAIGEDGLMEYLTYLEAENAGVTDLTGLEHAVHLRVLHLWKNSVSDLSPLAGLDELEGVYLGGSSASNISPLAGLINLDSLFLDGNGISNLSPLIRLTKLRRLALNNNSISDLSPLVGLTNLRWMRLASNNISDLSPLVANTGLGNEDEVDVRGNPLNYASIYTRIPELQSRGVIVEFDTRKVQRLLKISGDNQQGTVGEVLADPLVVEVRDRNGTVFAEVPVTFTVTEGSGTLSVASTNTDENGRAEITLTLGLDPGTNTVVASAAEMLVIFNATANPRTTEYLWSIPSGTSLIHVPLKVTTVDGVAKTITTISDLYAALGGADVVNFLITYDSQAQDFRTYFGILDSGTSADVDLTDDTGVIAGLKTAVSVRLTGLALGIDGNSTMTLHQGLNLVGLPLDNSSITRVSDLFALDGIRGNVPVIILTDGGDFQSVGRAGDPSDIPITGGQGFILTAQQPATVTISGEAWTNASGSGAAPSLEGIVGRNTTPVLALRSAVVDERTGGHRDDFRVTVKNLSTGKTISGMTQAESSGYQLTVVDIEKGRAATIGDTLEITAQSPDPFIGVQPLRYTVTAEDVKQSLIQLPELVAYEIPRETQLLANYPNPFNPETWIPYRLAADAFVTLTIYDLKGRVVRTLEVGHRIAAVYEDRSKAIYWDGRNEFGETVASGVYFYQLSAGDYSATRRMIILK